MMAMESAHIVDLCLEGKLPQLMRLEQEQRRRNELAALEQKEQPKRICCSQPVRGFFWAFSE